MNSDFDLSLLADSVLAQLGSHPSVQDKTATKDFASSAAAAAANTDWLLFSASASDNIPAPHPDLFESDIDSLLFDTDLSSFPSLDFDVASNPSFYSYRSTTGAGNSTYSGYGPSTITASSESLSAYGSAYESSVYSPIQSKHTTPSVSALLQDIDLSAFTLSGLQKEEAMLPHYLHIDTDTDVKPNVQNSPSAYDAASNLVSSLSPSYYPMSVTSAVSPSAYHTQGSSRAAGAAAGITAPGQSSASIHSVPANSNSSLIGATINAQLELQSEADPRKKYQCPSCPRAFARAFNLKTHMATHDPHRVKAFQCPHSGCGRSFSRKHDLGRHLVSIHQDNSVAGSATVAAASGSITRASMGAKSVGNIDNAKLGRHGCECDSNRQVH